MSADTAKPILIAGGGIGGLTAAVALRRAGLNVEIFERAGEIREVGAGIAIQPNAVLALRRIGLDSAVAAVSCIEERLDLWTSDGTLLACLRPRELVPDAPFLSLHRAALQEVLLQALGREGLHTGCECVAYEARPDGVTLLLRDGRRIEGTALVGADGLHSRVREQLLGDGEPPYAGYTAWRAVTPEGFAPRPGGSSETWGIGHRFGIVPIGHGRVYWYATSNAPAGGRDEPGVLRDSLLRVFGGWHSPVRELIAATPESAILRTDVRHRHPVRRWGERQGDASGRRRSPLDPQPGTGRLPGDRGRRGSRRLPAHDPGPTAALRRYEARRRPRTAGIARRAFHLGWIGQWTSPPACRLRDRLVAWTPDAFNRLQMRHLFRFPF